MIVIEGIDKAGKSTFAKTLNKPIIHYPLSHISTYTGAKELLTEMVTHQRPEGVVLDRFWPSTLVYQNIIENQDLLGACKLLQILLPIDKMYYVYPKDFETWIHRMAKGDDVMLPTLQNYTDMVERYSRVMLACMAVGIPVESIPT